MILCIYLYRDTTCADTQEPTTSSTTSDPTTAVPTTSEPTTSEPTTSETTTSEPTTSEPTTSEPTTSEPTTAMPTTDEPTNNPTDVPTIDGCDFDIEAYLEQCYCPVDSGYGQGISTFYGRNGDYKYFGNNPNNYGYYGNNGDNNMLMLIYVNLTLNVIILGYIVSVHSGCCGMKNTRENKYEKVIFYSDPEDSEKNVINE